MQRAEGDASRFRQILVEYAKAPGVTRERLYLDMMQSVLGNSSKVLVDQKAGSNSLLYLPLDKLIQQSGPPTVVSAPAAELPAARQPAPPAPEPAATLDPGRSREALRTRERGGNAMKFTMPLLALLVAVLLVALAVALHGRPAQYAIKFQLGEIIETQPNAGLYFKVPLLQNVKFYDKRILTPRQRRARPDHDVREEAAARRLLRAWRITDVKQYYISVQGDEEAARRRLSQTVRANLAEEFNKRTMHEAISAERDKIMTDDAAEGRRRREDDRRRDRRRAAAPRRAAARRHRPGLSRGWNPSAGASPTSCARSARPSPRRSAPTPTASAW